MAWPTFTNHFERECEWVSKKRGKVRVSERETDRESERENLKARGIQIRLKGKGEKKIDH